MTKSSEAAQPPPPAKGPRQRRMPTARPAAHLRIAASVGAEPNGVEDIRDAVSRLKRERIISAAVELFYGNGFGNTTLEAVAERMNVTKPFIYSHFSSKKELLAAICSHGISESLDALNRVVASDGSATDKLLALAREFMITVIHNQAHIAIYTREEKHLSADDSKSIKDMRREFDAKVCLLLSEGVTAGEFVVDDVHLASLAIGGIVSWSYVWYRPNGRLTAEQTADRIAELVLAMVQAKATRRKRTRQSVYEAA